MSLKNIPVPPVPEDTARVARKAFRKGNPWVTLRDEIGVFTADVDYTSLFSERGRPAESPWRLAMIICFQFAEGLSDRQAADAVRSRIDWKYALSLPIDYEGFDPSVLCEFRSRLLEGQTEMQLFQTLLDICRQHKLLKVRGQQRTDATNILTRASSLNRLENIGSTFQQALNTVSSICPDWICVRLKNEWNQWPQRYEKRLEEYRLPKNENERNDLAVQIGLDGQALLNALEADKTMIAVANSPAIKTLRRVWMQQYYINSTSTQWRNDKDHGLASCAVRIVSPYDTDARYSQKGDTTWDGYKVHITETCDDQMPRIITQVTTTPATTPDHVVLADIQQDLATHDLLPSEQIVDSGYVEAGTLVKSQSNNIELCGPTRPTTSWQARAKAGFAASDFHYDFSNHTATCPQGNTSKSWKQRTDRYGQQEIQIKFSVKDCKPCQYRNQCTKTASARRLVTIQPQAEFKALQEARDKQLKQDFKQRYAKRAGIEATLSQAVRRCNMRRSRYIGLAKTHMQNIFIAIALNSVRIVNWLLEIPIASTRISAFANCCKVTVLPA